MSKVAAATAVLTLFLAMPAVAAPQQLQIELANDTEREALTRDAVLRLVAEHDVERWLFTREIVIDEESIPHSHPVLTLHTRSLGDDAGLLATFLHEQFHWLESERRERTAAAIEELRGRYPAAPDGGPQGARDLYSTYLHLIVCDLELQATTLLLGADIARATLANNRHYTWIYDKVLNDPAVREINTRHGFTVE